MPEHRKFRIADLISIILSLVTLFTVITAGFFWFYKTDALPARVEKTENRLTILETQMVENSTKTELIYQGILEIRSVLLRR